jgi:hypothetical protein
VRRTSEEASRKRGGKRKWEVGSCDSLPLACQRYREKFLVLEEREQRKSWGLGVYQLKVANS